MFIAWGLFYRKIFLYTLLLTALSFFLVLGEKRSIQVAFLGYVYAVLSPATHLFFYEFSRPQEYYFYANLGLLRRDLWKITVGISLLLTLVISLLK